MGLFDSMDKAATMYSTTCQHIFNQVSARSGPATWERFSLTLPLLAPSHE